MRASLLLLIVTVFTCISCQKDDLKENPVSKCKLIKATQGTIPGKDTVHTFRYNADGLPAAILTEQGKSSSPWRDFNYKSGKLEKVTRTNPETGALWTAASFEYDGQGRVSRAVSFLSNDLSFQYDEKGVLKRVNKTANNSGGGYFLTFYDDKGSLIEYRSYDAKDQLRQWCKIEYSDVENTMGVLNFLGIGELHDFYYLIPGGDFAPFTSKYMAKTLTFLNENKTLSSVTRITYETDKEGNVIKAISKTENLIDPSWPGTTFTWAFEYECN